MVKQKTIEDPNKEIWLLRVPSSISLDAVNNLPIAKEQGNVGDIVARSKGAARDHGGPVGRAFGGDIVIREESALADDMRPLVKTRSGSLRCAGVPVSRQLSLAVEHDPATTEMDASKHVPSIVAPAVESVWSQDPIGEELLGKDFAEKTGMCCVEINQCVGCTFFTKSFLGDGAAVLARSSGEERAPPRHRASVASMAWRTT